MDSQIIIMCVAAVALVVILFFLSKVMNKASKKDDSSEEKPQEQELTERFRMGGYVDGFAGMNGPAPIVSCGVTEETFLFCKGTQGVEVGRIPRDKIIKVSTAAQGKHYGVVIDWADAAGAKHTTQFKFEDKNSEALATQTAGTINKWIKQKGSAAASA